VEEVQLFHHIVRMGIIQAVKNKITFILFFLEGISEMTEYYVCSDNIDGKENSRIEALIKALEKNGHTAHNGGVGPNTVQSHGLTSGAKGQMGVFIVGGSDAGMYVDFRDGLKRGYYHYKYMYVVFASETATTDKWITCNGLANTPLVRAWDDNYSGSSIESVGKSAKAYFDANKQYISYACGNKGCSFDDVIKNFIEGNGGSTDTDKKGTSSGSTAKDAIQKLLTHWDGEVECYIRDDTVYINKIKEPSSDYTLVLQEGVNILSDSLQITDVNPNTVNLLKVTWTKGTITLKDEELIKRFGEVEKEVQAVKKITTTETVTKTTSSTSTDTTTTDGTDLTDTATDTANAAAEDAGAETTETTTKTTVVEEPIDNYKDALEFANIEWNKIKRDNGHTIECQVRGSNKWQVGEWVKVIIPSFNENGFMYITRASQSDDGGDWNCNISLADYPPGWGKEEVKTTDDTEDTSTDDTSSEDTTTEE